MQKELNFFSDRNNLFKGFTFTAKVNFFQSILDSIWYPSIENR